MLRRVSFDFNIYFFTFFNLVLYIIHKYVEENFAWSWSSGYCLCCG